MGKLWEEADSVGENELKSAGNSYLQDPASGLQLIARLISQPTTRKETAQHIEELDRLIHYAFLELCKAARIPNEADLFQRLKNALADLEDAAEFPVLINKKVVAVAGGFSAGKSRFINSLIGSDLLPTDPRPTTVIPTYIVNGQEADSMYALNTFKERVALDPEAVKAISHDFNRVYGVGFSHVVDVMIMESRSFAHSNIALLDTPGYSNPDSVGKQEEKDGMLRGDNTDEKKALEHLRHVDHLIWVVDIVKGTLTESDIQFLRKLGLTRSKPIFVVLNKADLKIGSDVEKIMKVVRERLKTAGIPFAGILAYSALLPERELMGESIEEYLKGVNEKQKFARLHRGFDDVFEEIARYNEEENKRNIDIMKAFNIASLRGDDLFNSEDQRLVERAADQVRNEVGSIDERARKFSELREKMNLKVRSVLQHIAVKDESDDCGIIGDLIIQDKYSLGEIESGRERMGTVRKIDAFGVYVDCGLSDEIMLHNPDIAKHCSQPPHEVFRHGGQYKVRIVSVDHTKGIVRAAVMPGKEEDR